MKNRSIEVTALLQNGVFGVEAVAIQRQEAEEFWGYLGHDQDAV